MDVQLQHSFEKLTNKVRVTSIGRLREEKIEEAGFRKTGKEYII